MLKRLTKVLLVIVLLFIYIPDVLALTGTVNVNDSLTLRKSPSVSGEYIDSFANDTVLTILDTNAGTDSNCNSWYKVQYGSYVGYACGDYIILNNDGTSNNAEDDTYKSSNYNNATNKDGTIMCYEDTGSVTLRSSANGSKLSGKTVDCGEDVKILDITETKNNTCPYWYKIDNGKYSGYLCGYFVNTTKLSSTAQNYYNNKTNGDTIESYTSKLKNAKFPDSYIPYLLEIHARHPKWNFVADKINIDFDEAVEEESIDSRNVLQWGYFDKGYLSPASHSYDLWTDNYKEADIDDDGYYNASKEAIAYYMDPRNYLNEKYIFAFETLQYTNDYNKVISGLVSGQSFFKDIYAKNYSDGKGNVVDDIIYSASEVGISSVHVASRIRQEMGVDLTISDSRLGGTFTYDGINRSGYYNFFNIKCYDCKYKYVGYAYEKGWNTPFKGIYGGAQFLYNGYISVGQDTVYYEKFDVSTTNGHYTHQFQQNLAVAPQETSLMYNRLVSYGVTNYFDADITFVIPVYNNMPKYAVIAPKLGSNNNYLKGLTVNGTNVSNFSYNTYNYNVYLDKNTTSVSIGAIKMLGSASVSGTGDIKISSDNQTNQIVVTSESGKTRIYTIKFTRDSMESTTVSDAMNHSGFKYNNDYMYGIKIGTNVSQLINNISSYNRVVGVSITDKNGKAKTNDSFRTGDKVTITGTDGKKTYTVLIYGDVDGDGVIDKVDLLNIQSKVFGYSKFDVLKTEVADIDRNGTVDKKDLLAVQSHVFGYSQIKQS